MRLATLQQEKSLILYDADSLCDATGSHQVQSALFTAAYWQQHGRVTGEAPGRGNSLFIQPSPDDRRQWVLRHYLRGGLIARLSQDRYCWLGQKRTRPFAEMRLNAHLFKQGLPVPRPIAACVTRCGFTYRASLITQRIDGAHALAEWLRHTDSTAAQRRQVLTDVGRMIRRFHTHGLDHVDLNARNILIDTQGKPWLIDLDRCRLRSPGKWQVANLKRLERSLTKLLPEHGMADRQSIQAGYQRSAA